MNPAPPTASSSSSRPPAIEQLLSESRSRRAQITAEIDEADDPLALYDQFVKWTFDKYPQEYLASSGLLELVEEATRRYKDDSSYRSDLRYLKLWSLYASLVDKPVTVFKFVLAREIGTVYALLYEEYALTLERDGRHQAADTVYRAGITRKARPLERLKKRYDDFCRRTSAQPPIPPPNPAVCLPKFKGTPEADVLRRLPLKNHEDAKASTRPPAPVQSVDSAPPPASSSSHSNNPYASMLAPPAPGKRPEKLRIDLPLLFTKDGIEYSMPEVRARSIGLLGKKWGPPPASELIRDVPSSHQAKLGDTTGKPRRNFQVRKSLAGEPTVTINTKEALADVFGMYNSPEKSMRFATVPGSKHAPLRKVEPVTPMAPLSQVRKPSDENAKTPTAFTPFMDENNTRKENTGPAKVRPLFFRPFVDGDSGATSKPPAVTPDGRRALMMKESAVTPASALKSKPDENALGAIFSRVFTPAAKVDLKLHEDVFANDRGATKGTKFVPFVDAHTPFKVFSRPPDENSAVAKPGSFAPFIDSDPPPVPARSGLSHRQPLRAFAPTPVQEVEEDEDKEFAGDDEGVSGQPTTDYHEDDYQSYGAPLGGRFGQFNVMTPITERTFEYTTSSRLSAMDGDHTGVERFAEPEAIEAAERLAAELRKEELDIFPVVEQQWSSRRRAVDDSPSPSFEDESQPSALPDGHASSSTYFREESAALLSATAFVEEKTGTLSLSDAIAVSSAFNPPNPCNPFDPPIISTLLSLLPADHGHHDLWQQEANLLEGLQRFARKRERRPSGNTSSHSDDARTFPVVLADCRFSVYEKLGEGGFGAVFAAKDVSSKKDMDDEDLDDDDDDDEESKRVALKVVRPRNLWEFHVLRKVHSSLPSRLRASVVRPHALYAFRDESFLVLDLCTQGSLLEIINRAPQAGITQQGACLDELLVVFFTIEFLRLLEGLHNAGFIHGDLKIDNCLIRLDDVPGGVSAWSGSYQPSGEGGWSYKGIKVIDFGRTIDTRMFPHKQTFIAEWATDARDCFEMREDRPWTYQADYFGLAGIIFCMLYGKYIEASSVVASPGEPGRYKLSTPFKRYWQTDIWTRLFDILLNPCLVRPNGQLPVSDELAHVRVEMETWLQANCNRSSNTLKGLLKKIERAVVGGD
ncbi:hypothetical protein BV25DRAFT_1811268 [Artomyces pyxidatus]|uniref:Uncharacterized protein n=1 Tax=Artomyces pyxidatus TaxID=48021 RepID=A0ACB8SQR2_9AGAM|nr:hypothetical protein BV25DRAFT_1811268 [Artomyces pyxidatus]